MKNFLSVLLILLNCFEVLGQHGETALSGQAEKISYGKLGISMLHAYLPAGSQEEFYKSYLILPALELELFYHMNHKWGIIRTNEVTQSFVANNEKEDHLERVSGGFGANFEF